MNWVKKQHRHSPKHGTHSGSGKRVAPECDDDTLGDYVRPSAYAIEVQELTEEEFAELLQSQRPA